MQGQIGKGTATRVRGQGCGRAGGRDGDGSTAS